MGIFLRKFCWSLILLGTLSLSAQADVKAVVSIKNQTMLVVTDNQIYTWPVSTARKGYHTPTGSFTVKRMAAKYFSKKYDKSPMPYSVFFSGGYAVHGTTHIKSLGHPASHGCVRLHPENAATFFDLVRDNGNKALIEIGE